MNIRVGTALIEDGSVLYFNYCELSNSAYRKLYKNIEEAKSSSINGTHFHSLPTHLSYNEISAELHPYNEKSKWSFSTKVSADKKYITGFSSHVEDKVQANKLYLLSQEHRFIAILRNLYSAFKNNDKHEKWSSIKSLFFYFKPGGRVALIIGGGFLIGVPTISLMQKNNEYVASQNFQLQKQIYVQANSDRRLQLASIIEYLYKNNIDRKQENLPAISPEFNRYIRMNALKQIVAIGGTPLDVPKREKKENISKLVGRVICENTGFYCADKPDKNNNDSSELSKSISFIVMKICGSSDKWYGKEFYCKRLVEFEVGENYNFKESVSDLLYLKEIHCLDNDESDVCVQIKQAVQENVSFKPTVDVPEALLNDMVWPDTNNVVINAENAYVKGTKFDSSSLFSSDFGEADFSGAELTTVDMRWSNLLGIDFSDAKISGGDFNSSEMSYMTIKNTEFVGVKMNFVTLEETDFRAVSLIKGCSFIGAKMAKSIFEGVDISRNDFKSVDLEGSNLKNTNLHDIRFENANLKKVLFNGANFKGVLLKNADIDGADFSEAVNISCETLKTAKNWANAKSDLECI